MSAEIAPDDFVARSSASTLRAALKEAERQTSREAEREGEQSTLPGVRER